MLLIFSLFFGCTGEKVWETQEDCHQLEKGDIKDDCWSNFIVDVFAGDRKSGAKIMEDQISNSKVRDFLWLEITRKVDPSSMTYCKEIKDKTLLERCKTLVSRPHLHRETLRDSKPKKKLVPSRKPQ